MSVCDVYPQPSSRNFNRVDLMRLLKRDALKEACTEKKRKRNTADEGGGKEKKKTARELKKKFVNIVWGYKSIVTPSSPRGYFCPSFIFLKKY